eukprot:gene11148-12320_t
MLNNTKRQAKKDGNSLLYSYYTLTHPSPSEVASEIEAVSAAATEVSSASAASRQEQSLQVAGGCLSQSRCSPESSKRIDHESGDETDRSVEPENEIVESFFMDEINVNSASCSLRSSRENLLDSGELKQGSGSREGVRSGGSRPNSRPSSAKRRTAAVSTATSELPADERIKILEEGLKEADMEREVVLSCLGKEYLERLTMQNCLQEICSKSGYSYEEIKASMDVQNGANSVLSSMIEIRKKAMGIKDKGTNVDVVRKGEESGNERSSEDKKNIINDNNNNDSVIRKDELKRNVTNTMDTIITEEKLKEVVTKIIQAEQPKLNIHTRKEDDEVSHSTTTKRPSQLHQPTAVTNKADVNSIVGIDNIIGALETDKGSLNGIGQSDGVPVSADKNTAMSENDDKKTSGYFCVNDLEKSEQTARFGESSDKNTNGVVDSPAKNMPLLFDPRQQDGSAKLEEQIDKMMTSTSSSLDSVDEGIYMLKTFLTELSAKSQRSPGGYVSGFDRVNTLDDYLGEQVAGYSGSLDRATSQGSSVRDGKPRRKLSLNELSSYRKPDSKPSGQRSLAEGMVNFKSTLRESQKSDQSRLLRPTLSSQNKAKDRIGRRDAGSDSESVKTPLQGNGKTKKRGFSRSATDISDYSSRLASYTSTEEDSSVDGDEDARSSLKYVSDNQQRHQSFRYVYEMNQTLSDKEYAKLTGILNMLQDQKRKWEDEVRALKLENSEMKKSKLDLSRENGVLRKSLEAANHAIKEINSKVQELKLTIVPLRDENSKIREQNGSLKSKLELLRKDKTSLLQEFQELKKTKLNYENKLQLVIDLYQNGRINLAAEQNNNHSAEAFAKGGLKALLDMNNNSDGTNDGSGDGASIEAVKLRRRRDLGQSIRNLDKSKRHSFDGFDRIEELAGNAEELLAEKDKIEGENLKLKEELVEVKQKLEESNKERMEMDEEDGVFDEDAMNQRKGWRMQREESKHRIIREILKTKSSQHMYGRPYSSCGDLTLAENPEYAGRKEWGQGKQGRGVRKDGGEARVEVQTSMPKSRRLWGGKGSEMVDEGKRANTMKDEDEQVVENDKESSGYISFEVPVKRNSANAKSKSVVSWKKESEKIERRLATFDFGKGKKLEDGGKRGTCVMDGGIDGSDQVVTGVKGSYSVKAKLDAPDDDGRQSVSRPSKQWPIVKEKIEAIFKQPVDLEFVKEREDDSLGHGNAVGADEDKEQNGVVDASRYSKYEPQDMSKNEWREMARSRATRRSVQEMVARHVMQSDGDDSNDYHDHDYGDYDWSEERLESEWQRKTSDGENDYETYRQITKQRERAKKKSKNRMVTNEFRGRQSDDSRVELDATKISVLDASFVTSDAVSVGESNLSGGSRAKPSTSDGSRLKTQTIGVDKVEVIRNRNKTNTTRKKEKETDVTQGKSGTSSRKQTDLTDGRGDFDGGKDGSPWIDVAGYWKVNKKANTVPTKPSKEARVGAEQKGKEKKIKTKAVEETISKVESAFSVTKAAEKKMLKKNDNNVIKSKPSAKNSKSNSTKDVRQTTLYLDELSDSTTDDDSQGQKIVLRRTKSLRKPRPKSEYWSSAANDCSTSSSWQRSGGDSFRRTQSLRKRLSKQSKDDMFTVVDISLETESDAIIQQSPSDCSSIQDDSLDQLSVENAAIDGKGYEYKQQQQQNYHNYQHFEQHQHSLQYQQHKQHHEEYQQQLQNSKQLQYQDFQQYEQHQQHIQHHHPGNVFGQKEVLALPRQRVQSETGTSNTTRSSSLAKRAKTPGGFSCEMCREMNKRKTAQEKYCWEKYFPIGETTVDVNANGYLEDYV